MSGDQPVHRRNPMSPDRGNHAAETAERSRFHQDSRSPRRLDVHRQAGPSLAVSAGARSPPHMARRSARRHRHRARMAASNAARSGSRFAASMLPNTDTCIGDSFVTKFTAASDDGNVMSTAVTRAPRHAATSAALPPRRRDRAARRRAPGRIAPRRRRPPRRSTRCARPPTRSDRRTRSSAMTCVQRATMAR